MGRCIPVWVAQIEELVYEYGDPDFTLSEVARSYSPFTEDEKADLERRYPNQNIHYTESSEYDC